jgi:hypothetical protein
MRHGQPQRAAMPAAVPRGKLELRLGGTRGRIPVCRQAPQCELSEYSLRLPNQTSNANTRFDDDVATLVVRWMSHAHRIADARVSATMSTGKRTSPRASSIVHRKSGMERSLAP